MTQKAQIEQDSRRLDKNPARLIAWVDRFSNYLAVESSISGQSLSSFKIGNESADDVIARVLPKRLGIAIPDSLKVTLMCEALYNVAKKQNPALSETELQAEVVEQMITLVSGAKNPSKR